MGTQARHNVTQASVSRFSLHYGPRESYSLTARARDRSAHVGSVPGSRDIEFNLAYAYVTHSWQTHKGHMGMRDAAWPGDGALVHSGTLAVTRDGPDPCGCAYTYCVSL